jgi:hypothetical protein
VVEDFEIDSWIRWRAFSAEIKRPSWALFIRCFKIRLVAELKLAACCKQTDRRS